MQSYEVLGGTGLPADHVTHPLRCVILRELDIQMLRETRTLIFL